ncbi:PREDICTED: uncharacterized protein LOC106110187, partial [Papilio polytes]|uniref:uncharacterized protein LOC106110187 n=1 Tax=Papilio polytes TaxID=76194 RepID=UPI000676A460
IIVMSYPWGYLSDTRGRKLVLMYAMCGSFVSAALSSLAPSWQVLAALRFISSAMSSAAESATYALLGECCNSRSRARYMLLMTSALMLTPTLYYIWGYFITKLDFSIPLLGIVYRPWRLLTLVMALPLGIGALLLYFFSESPKFLLPKPCIHQVLSISILLVAAAAAFVIDNTGEPISGLIFFYIFLTTAMVFGVVSSYFVDLYPTSYRGMVACLGMMVARLSAFAGTNLVSSNMTEHCSLAIYSIAGLVISKSSSSSPAHYSPHLALISPSSRTHLAPT